MIGFPAAYQFIIERNYRAPPSTGPLTRIIARQLRRAYVVPPCAGNTLLSRRRASSLAQQNGGESWSRLARGLPKRQSYFTVLHNAMDIDRLKAPALYFGTTTGQLWIGRDGGEQWDCLFDSSPPIHNVKVAVV